MVLIIVNITTIMVIHTWQSSVLGEKKICCENCGRDDIGHCAGKVRAFPHRQEQFLSKELVVLQQHLAQRLAPRCGKPRMTHGFYGREYNVLPMVSRRYLLNLLLYYIYIYYYILSNIAIDNIILLLIISSITISNYIYNHI